MERSLEGRLWFGGLTKRNAVQLAETLLLGNFIEKCHEESNDRWNRYKKKRLAFMNHCHYHLISSTGFMSGAFSKGLSVIQFPLHSVYSSLIYEIFIHVLGWKVGDFSELFFSVVLFHCTICLVSSFFSSMFQSSIFTSSHRNADLNKEKKRSGGRCYVSCCLSFVNCTIFVDSYVFVPDNFISKVVLFPHLSRCHSGPVVGYAWTCWGANDTWPCPMCVLNSSHFCQLH